MSDLTWRSFVHAAPGATRHLRAWGDSYTLCNLFQPSTRPADTRDVACSDCQALQAATVAQPVDSGDEGTG